MFRGEETPLADIARTAGIPYYQVFQRYQRDLRGEDLVMRHKSGRKPKQ
jgi:predicted transcriptional regulator